MGLSPNEMQSIQVDGKMWRFSLEHLPNNIQGKASEKVICNKSQIIGGYNNQAGIRRKAEV